MRRCVHKQAGWDLLLPERRDHLRNREDVRVGRSDGRRYVQRGGTMRFDCADVMSERLQCGRYGLSHLHCRQCRLQRTMLLCWSVLLWGAMSRYEL